MIHLNNKAHNLLPYDNTHPVIYDNDSHEDMYTDEYLMALASSGDIKLKGIITTASYVDAWQKPEIQFGLQAGGREEIVGIARRSGMKNIPDAVRGSSIALQKPLSGRIEDTVSIDTPGSRLIIKEARLASPQRSLVIIMGGQATSVADAYLLDNSIAKNVIVAWLVGEGGDGNSMYGYNGWVDPWGSYIIASRFKLVAFGADFLNTAVVEKQRLMELPETELREFMVKKELPHVNLPAEMDVDVQAAIALMRPDYVEKVERKSFSGFGRDGVPLLKNDENGNIYMVTKLNRNIATDEWWRTLKNPLAYGGDPKKPSYIPYNGVPFSIPGVIEAEQFDFGGEGVSYHSRDSKNGSQTLKAVFRMTEHVKFDHYKNRDVSYIVEELQCNDWLGYTVDVKTPGKYRFEILCASGEHGAVIHLQFDGLNKSGIIKIPGTGGWDEQHKTDAGIVTLDKGKQVMRLVCDSGKLNLDYISFINEKD